MSLNGSGKRGQQLGKAALAKANTVTYTFTGEYGDIKSKFSSLTQDFGISYDLNNNILSNSVKDNVAANTSNIATNASNILANNIAITKNANNISTNAADINTLQSNVTEHKGDVSNPHSVTKAQVGLNNVDNTSDKNKPISTAVQTALNLKQDISSSGYTGSLLVVTDVDFTNKTSTTTQITVTHGIITDVT